MNKDLKDVRKNYLRAALLESEVAENPFIQFSLWFDVYKKLGNPDYNAMVISTVGPSGVPSSRVVLLKEIKDEAFVFFTNYQSEKGQHISANPKVCLLFFWPELEQQVRVTGLATRIATEESKAYFHSRPVESQLGAITSPQSQIVPNRSYLEKVFEENKVRFSAIEALPMPENWGGYAIAPDTFEFWQGRSNRLHDRIKYQKDQNGDWIIARLAP